MKTAIRPHIEHRSPDASDNVTTFEITQTGKTIPNYRTLPVSHPKV